GARGGTHRTGAILVRPDLQAAADGASLVDQHGPGRNVPGHHTGRLQLGAFRRVDVAEHASADDDFTRDHVAFDFSGLAEYDQVGLADGSPQLAVEPEGALGLEVAAQYDLRVEHGAS